MTLTRMSQECYTRMDRRVCTSAFSAFNEKKNHNNKPDINGPVSFRTHLTHDAGSVLALRLCDVIATF
jgi:hypothetical protein